MSTDTTGELECNEYIFLHKLSGVWLLGDWISDPWITKAYPVCYILHNSLLPLYIFFSIVYTEFILFWLCRKLLGYRNTLKSIPGTNQYWAISVKFPAHGNNGLPLTGFEPMQLAYSIYADHKHKTFVSEQKYNIKHVR